MTDTTSTHNSRRTSSITEDIEAFVPEAAEPLWGDGDPTDPVIDPIFVTDEYAYNTGVHCRQCYCDVARTDRETGEVTCPNCGWSSAGEQPGWHQRAAELRKRGGVSKRQAQVVALIEAGHSHSEVVDELGLGGRGEVSTHISRYRQQRDEVQWLADHGPEI